MKRFMWALTLCVCWQSGWGKDILTNAITTSKAPLWLRQPRIEKVTDRIQSELEWSIRRVEMRWYLTEGEFMKAHGLGPQAIAVTKLFEGVSSIHMGPLVNTKNFDAVFGHELVHVIVNQKYKGAIPKWLEEGLANHLAKRGKVDYRWLAKQPFPEDVRGLAHPFQGS